jgi:repressor LexA
MSDGVDITSIRAALRREMARKKVGPTTLSLEVGSNRTLVKNLLEDNSDVRLATLTKLAGALDVPLEALLQAPPVPIVGYIGAGGQVLFEEFETEEAVLRPPGITGKLEALVVRGDSMLPKYRDGDIIYIQRAVEGMLEDYIGEECAVRLETGEAYLKQLIKGSEPQSFTLLSLNAPPIENVRVEWATPVAFVMPARSRQVFAG